MVVNVILHTLHIDITFIKLLKLGWEMEQGGGCIIFFNWISPFPPKYPDCAWRLIIYEGYLCQINIIDTE